MKTGLKSKIIYSNIDLEILLYLQKYVENILGISKALKIKHLNLKPHIDKLYLNGFIKREKESLTLLTLTQKGNALIRYLDIDFPKKIDFRRKVK